MTTERGKLLSKLLDTIQMLRAKIEHITRVEHLLEEVPELYNFAIRIKHEREDEMKGLETDVRDLIEAEVDDELRATLEVETMEQLKENPYIKNE